MTAKPYTQILRELADQQPNKIAVRCDEDSITYQALDLQSNRLARAYQDKGVKADDFVTVALRNGLEFFTVCFALWKLGATPQPVSYRLPKKELEAIAALAKTPFVITEQERQLKDYSEAPLPEVISQYWKAPTSGGSTGRPKLIVTSEPAVLDPTATSAYQQPVNGVVLVPGPVYHNGPFIAALHGLLRGNHIILMPKFDAAHCLEILQQDKVNWVGVVPTMMHRIWRLVENDPKSYDLSSLNTLIHFAAPCASWLKKAWIDWLGAEVIYELYGGAEGHGYTLIRGDEWLSHQGSVGKVQPGCRIKIVNENNKAVSAGETGLIYFLPDKGQGSTYHYIGAESDVIEGGWETLGDMGYFDEDGYLYLCDRKKDMILSGGANIYPAEVEGAIESHPEVRSAIVVGLPDEDLGQKVHALVDAPNGLTEQNLLDFLSKELVRYKIPRSFEFVNEPLRDDAGKARRSALASAITHKE